MTVYKEFHREDENYGSDEGFPEITGEPPVDMEHPRLTQ